MANLYYKNDTSNTFRISKNQIIRLVNRKNEQVYVPIPLGLNLDSYDKLEENESSVILSSSEKHKNDFFKEIILPKKPKPMVFKDFSISLIYDTIDYQEALDLLHHEHYILNLPIGLPIILKKADKIIGVIYFSKLTHGNPDGRMNFLKGKGFNSKKKIREFATHHIGCIDRIVIDSKKQGIGAGKLFAEKLGDFLKSFFISDNFKAIEVMTSWTIEEFIKKKKTEPETTNINEVVFNEDTDFFHKAGYMRISQQNDEAKHPKPERTDKGRLDKLDRKQVDGAGVITHKKEKVIRYYYIKELDKSNGTEK